MIAIALFSLIKDFSPNLILGALAGTFLGMIFSRYKFLDKFAILVLVLSFLFTSIANSGELRNYLSRDLPLFTYNNDPGIFLKTFQLVEENVDYYDAYKNSFLGRFSTQIYPTDIWGWRLPTIFYIWKFFPGPGGLSVYFLFLILASAFMYCSYKLVAKCLGHNLAILSPYMILPYFHYAARDQMLLETEWWGLFLFFIFIYFLIWKKTFYATVLLSLAVMTRELYLIPIFTLLVYLRRVDRKFIPIFSIPILAFLVIFAYHLWRVNYYIDVFKTLLTPRLVSDGLFFIQQTLAFASWEYLLNILRPLAILVVFAIIGCFKLFRTVYRQDSVILMISFLPLMVAFLKIGTLPYNDYWGIMYVPIAVSLSPLVLLDEKRKI